MRGVGGDLCGLARAREPAGDRESRGGQVALTQDEAWRRGTTVPLKVMLGSTDTNKRV